MNKRNLTLSLTIATALATSGCFHNDDDNGGGSTNTQARYQVSVANLTNGQPMSPVAIVVHDSGYTAWQLGSSASVGVEKLAEAGDSSDLRADADADGAVKATAVAGSGPFFGGSSVMTTVDANADADLRVTVAAMLGNTNDAFAGGNSVEVGDLAVGESHSLLLRAYDAGTEANTETAATVPGPAAGGTGYDAARDEYAAGADYVSVHRGVVTVDDGLATSALDESHRWNGPVAKLTVTRMR